MGDPTNESVSIEEAWDTEVARRIEDLKAGKAVTVPWVVKSLLRSG